MLEVIHLEVRSKRGRYDGENHLRKKEVAGDFSIPPLSWREKFASVLNEIGGE